MEASKYLTIVNWARDQVSRYKPGDRFHTEGELSELFGVSRQTVRQAVGMLETEGVLERRRGSGTYISFPYKKTEQTMTVGLITTFMGDYVLSSLMEGIESVLTKNNHSMQVAFTRNNHQKESQIFVSMLTGGVDGFIVIPPKNNLYNPNINIYQGIAQENIPLIFIDCHYKNLPFHCVGLDNVAAGRMATEYLIKAGHKKIAGFFMSDMQQGVLRYEGYVRALVDAYDDYDLDHVLWCSEDDIDDLFAHPRRILGRFDGCTGLVCFNDSHANRMMHFLIGNGIKIPEDMSVVGIDNDENSALMSVPLTSVNHPLEETGRKAAENLLELINKPGFNASYMFAPHMVERESVRRLL